MGKNLLHTKPYAQPLCSSVVTSETKARTTENVTAKIPEILTIVKYHQWLSFMKGMGEQVKVTVSRRNGLRPNTSDIAPISGALRNERNPLTPWINPFIRKVCSGKASSKTFNMLIFTRTILRKSWAT